VWYYTFGVHCKNKFTRSHAHLFHFVKDPNRFTFHADAVAVPSARQLVYADARANPKGRIPDDTWILRPQDCFDGLKPNEDTWYFPRVNGTFKERAGFHGCQMPEQLLGRIIRSCSNPEDVVLDPFSGSATTLAVAKKLGRHFLGFDLSQEYVALGTERLSRIAVGQPLEGAVDPKASAPATHQGKQRGEKSASKPRSKSRGTTESLPLFDLVADQDERLLEAFEASHRGASVDRVVVDPVLNEDFQRACDRLKIEGSHEQHNRALLRLRKSGRLLHIDVDFEQVVAPKWPELDLYLFASEIAWRRVADRYSVDLVELFCDARLASQFDAFAARYSPGFTPLEYRWGTLMLQEAIRSVPRSDQDSPWEAELGLQGWESAPAIPFSDVPTNSFPASPAVYALEDQATEQALYIGETGNLSIRIERQFGDGKLSTLYDTSPERACVRYLTIPSEPSRNQWRRTRLLERFPTQWNV
jgi:site-specific DNA-methyltransferase (adenine-specific)